MACTSCKKVVCCCKTKTIIQKGLNGRNGRNGRKGDKGDPGDSGSVTLPIANTAFVSKNGNDSTALVERLDKPFLTITAATTALDTAYPVGGRSNSNRKLVVVYDGTYQENVYFKKFIDYDLGNATINGRVGDNGVDMGSSGAEDWTNIIYGNARLYNTSTVTAGALLILKPNTKVLINCNEIISTKFEAIAMENGIARVICNKVETLDTVGNFSPAIEMLQGTSVADYTFSKLEVIGADISINSSANSCTIMFNDGTTFKNQILSLINCRVKNTNGSGVPDNGRSAIGCGIVGAGNGKLLLYNTTLYSLNGKSIYVNTGNTLTVSYYHSNMTNQAVGGAGTLTNLLTTSLTVNAAVEPGF